MSDVVYPLKVSKNKRYLVDQNNRPFLLQGDAAWSLLVGLSKEETEQYLKNRSEKGFNTIMVNLIEHKFCKDPPKNTYGEEPFINLGDLPRMRGTSLTWTGSSKRQLRTVYRCS